MVERKKREELFHRLGYPFSTVVLDRVDELKRDEMIKTVKWVSADEPCLSGHFPGNPIMPGVLTLEGIIQSALILLEGSHSRGKVQASLEKVERVRFKRAVLPGDRLDFLVNLTAREENLWKFKGKAQVGDEAAAEADLVLRVAVREVGFDL
ncbi:MAG: 3-hydroxyacyl-ACP dehydratase FabZ [Thermodesulfobacteriota bacterium]|nr:3-hydroxyacyl-ACP dehydratase FabZ [Thermodesulfobacteriota bacterium]